MSSSDEQTVQKMVATAFSDLLGSPRKVAEIIACAQERQAARIVADALWPELNPEDLVRLEVGDKLFLERSNQALEGISESAVKFLEIEMGPLIRSIAATNKYARGKKLLRIVTTRVDRKSADLSAAADRLFESKGTDRFASLTTVKAMVMSDLFDRSFAELQTLGNSDPEEEPKRRLKALTALTIQGGTRERRIELLKRVTDGRTASFPYVLKYIALGNTPTQPSFVGKNVPTIAGFTSDLLALIPEAAAVQASLQSYISRAGILTEFMTASAPVAEENADSYERLPQEFQIVPGGLILPKSVHLESHRTERYRLPDGIVCAVGTTIVLESMLRQAHRSLHLPGSVNARGRDMAESLKSVLPLSQDTQMHLRVVFGGDQMALRDAVSHGAFVANDEARIADVVGGLSRTLELLMDDIVKSPNCGTILSAPHWAGNAQIDPAHNATFDAQFAGNLNLFKNPHIEVLRKHAFYILDRLTPDKSLLGRVACLIWAELDGSTTSRLAGRPEAEFVGLIAALSVLEELFRAVHEVHGGRVLNITPDGAGVLKCELSILDAKQGRLLDPARMGTIFGNTWSDAEFRESVAAVEALRNKVLHGGWASLTLPKVRYLHLVVKFIITLCANGGGPAESTTAEDVG